MFKNEFDVTVSYTSKENFSFLVSEVSGDGATLSICGKALPQSLKFKLDSNDVRKLTTIFQEANKYIEANE